MDRDLTIHWIINNMFQEPIPSLTDLYLFLNKMTDADLQKIASIQELEDAGSLTTEDIETLRRVVKKYEREGNLLRIGVDSTII